VNYFSPLQKRYDKGQVIIKGESLLVAKLILFLIPILTHDWEKIHKHDYAILILFTLG
jgi:hypothetical protein